MRVSLAWLAEFVGLPPLDDLRHRLEMSGFEDVEIEDCAPELWKVRVGRVLEREQHPRADRLSVCRVEVGDDEPLEVVCGAPNVAAGQKVPVAFAGCRLPDGTKLKRSKIRGVVSNGMICSTRELGLGEDAEGIMVLDPDAPVGAPLPEVLPGGTRVLELGITPNRGDTASLLGLAREVRALFGGELCLPETEPPESGAPGAEAVTVEIEAPADCYHYVARVVRGIRVGASPLWLSRKLEASGIRSINAVVDVTNLVLLEFGQPLHAFDLARIRGGAVHVRKAGPGEKLVTLDDQTRELDPADLVIADAERPIALAGVMGGAETEVDGETTDILIESAHFLPARVRRCARRYGLHSEASYRFERGVDPGGVRRAADRAARLIAEVAGGEVAPGVVEARGEPAPATEEIRLEVERANRLLGTALSVEEVAGLLTRVGVECREDPPGFLNGQVPTHRNDLHVHQDLAEEVARIYGYDRIPTTLPEGALQGAEQPAAWGLAERARDALAGAGLMESISLPFLSPEDLERLRLDGPHPLRQALRVANPISEGEPLLRTTLVPSLLRLVRQNRSRQVDRVGLFEVGCVFHPVEGGDLPHEPAQATAVIADGEERHLWEAAEPPPLFFRARGIAETLLNQIGYDAKWRGTSELPFLHPRAAMTVEVENQAVGAVGELHPEVAARFAIDVSCAVIEIDLGALEALTPREVCFHEVSRFPQVRRDIAVVLDRAQPAGEVLQAVEETAGRDLVSAELYDRYEGRGVPEGRVSLAFRLVFQRSEGTLKDAEVNRGIDRVVAMLAQRFGGELR